jgi:hypothetical protein
MRLEPSPHVKRVKANALPKFVGFVRVLRFPSTGKVELRCVNDWVNKLLVSSAFWERANLGVQFPSFFTNMASMRVVFILYMINRRFWQETVSVCINTDRGYSLFKGLYSIYWYCFPSVTFKAL